MRILDENDNEIQESDVDRNLGYLVYEQLFVKHHDEVEAKAEEGHYYPTCVYFENSTKYVVDTENEDDAHISPNEDGKSFTYVPGEEEEPRDVRGMDVRWIVDSPQVDAKEAYDEYEDIQRYKLYTEEELQERVEQNAASNLAAAQQKQAVSFMRMMVAPMAVSMTDEQVMTVNSFLEEWNSESDYVNGTPVRYKGATYRAIVDITEGAQKLYTPDQYIAGWKRIDGEPNEDGIYPWQQPLGATDCYQVGDKVTFEGAVYESLIPNNVWSPSAYPAGWKKVDSEQPSPEPEPGGEDEEEYPEWVQPTGAHDAYKIGDKVSYNGKHYESLMDGNAWSPDAYPDGWREI